MKNPYTTGQNLRVLVADDDPVVRRLVQQMLVSAGFDVVVANDGTEALDRITQEPPDIVLSDFDMPGVNGIEVCRRVAEAPGDRPIQSILMTANRKSELKSDGLLSGADDFLPKPFTRRTLIAHVHAAARVVERARKLHVQSRMDTTTRLPNRRAFDELLERETNRARRYGRRLSCVMIDVDEFKSINDVHGHLAGDRVLASIASTIARTCRQSECACRYAGDEFVVLLPETPLTGARRCAERVVEAVRESRVEIAGASITATISAGVSEFDADSDSPISFVERADDDMFEAKACGRDRVGAEASRVSDSMSEWFSTNQMIQRIHRSRATRIAATGAPLVESNDDSASPVGYSTPAR